jgi:hypothetical protein
MKADVQKEHLWLSKLVGDWSFEAECLMGPGQPPVKTTGSQTVRMLGGLWMIGEGEGECPDGSRAKSIITLGYDPEKQRFVGTFIASMMTHLWPYEGTLDGNVLTLDSEGPSFSGDGTTVKYQDIVERRDHDHWILRSRMPGEDGKWLEFMTAHYRRQSPRAA